MGIFRDYRLWDLVGRHADSTKQMAEYLNKSMESTSRIVEAQTEALVSLRDNVTQLTARLIVIQGLLIEAKLVSPDELEKRVAEAVDQLASRGKGQSDG